MNVVARDFLVHAYRNAPAVFARKLIVCVTGKNYPYESFETRTPEKSPNNQKKIK